MVIIRVLRTQVFNLDVPESYLVNVNGDNASNLPPKMWQDWGMVEPLIADVVEDDWKFGKAHPVDGWEDLEKCCTACGWNSGLVQHTCSGCNTERLYCIDCWSHHFNCGACQQPIWEKLATEEGEKEIYGTYSE